MQRGFRVIDSDAHSMEPMELWDKYLDPKFRPWAPGGAKNKNIAGRRRVNEVGMGRRLDGTAGPPFIRDGKGGLITYDEAYAPYIEKQYDPGAYHMYMDSVGIDYQVLYPTTCLSLTTLEADGVRQEQSPEVAAALWRAYNQWLSDFCKGGEGRLLGGAGIDLRDADQAAKDVRWAVKELGLRAAFMVPQPALGIPLHDPYYDVLWGEIADLGIPIACHGSQGSCHAGTPYWGQSWGMGRAAVSFPMEEMMFCVMACAGGIFERHPKLKVVYLESSAGWAPFWCWWMDEKYKQKVLDPDTPEPPSHYFKRNCWISAEPDEPGISYCVQFGLEDNVVTATDFPHPEDSDFPNVLNEFFEVQPEVISQDQMRKILWDNPARLYGIEQ